jgi:hypothetical protein
MGKRLTALILAITLLGLGACASGPELKRKLSSAQGGQNLSQNYGIK